MINYYYDNGEVVGMKYNGITITLLKICLTIYGSSYMHKSKIFIFGDFDGKIGIILVGLFFIVGLVLMLFGIINTDYLIIGILSTVISLFLFVALMFDHGAAVLTNEEIKITNVFGEKFSRIIKSEKWTDLRSVEMHKINGGKWEGKYICLNFSNQMILRKDFLYLLHKPKIIIIACTEKNKKIVQQYLPEQFKYNLD